MLIRQEEPAPHPEVQRDFWTRSSTTLDVLADLFLLKPSLAAELPPTSCIGSRNLQGLSLFWEDCFVSESTSTCRPR